MLYLYSNLSNNQIKLTERVEEFGCLSPPQSLIVLGDDIIGFMFVNLCVKGHLVQKVVHLLNRYEKIHGLTIYIKARLSVYTSVNV